jgi:undecaprenyl-phosphate 4-deoxy-4-formamido-L-arabinose transferase
MREREPVAISVVIPVYRGEITLRSLAERLAPLTSVCRSPSGREFQITQVFLVWDHGPDDSPTVMRQLAADYPFIDCIWLTRNFGQHAATLAGITSSYGRWIVTMDEDGLHAPEEIPQTRLRMPGGAMRARDLPKGSFRACHLAFPSRVSAVFVSLKVT